MVLGNASLKVMPKRQSVQSGAYCKLLISEISFLALTACLKNVIMSFCTCLGKCFCQCFTLFDVKIHVHILTIIDFMFSHNYSFENTLNPGASVVSTSDKL